MKWLRSAMAVVLLLPSIAFGSDDPLGGVGALLLSGRGAEARDQLLRARDVFAAQGKASEEAGTWLLLGMAEASLGNGHVARTDLRQAADKFTAVGDFFGAWLSLWSLATIERQTGVDSAAIAAYKRVFDALHQAEAPGARFSMESMETIGPVFGANTDMLGPIASHPEILKPILLRMTQTISHDSYAKLLIDTGDLDAAEEHLRQASETAMLFGGLFDGSIALHYAQLRQQQWRLDEARQSYLKALQNAQTIAPMFTPPVMGADPWVELGVLRNLSELELLSGRLDEALAWNDRALKLIREKGDVKREAGVLRDRANLLEQGGRYDAALPLFEDALKLATLKADRNREALIHGDLGAAHMFRGAYGTAAKHLEKAIALHQALNQPYIEAPTWILLAEVYTLLEADANAEMALENARRLAEKSEFKAAGAMVDILATSRKLMSGRGSASDVDDSLRAMLKLPDARVFMFESGMADLVREIFQVGHGSTSLERVSVSRGTSPLLGAVSVMLKGISAVNRGEHEKARAHFKQALALNPSRDHKAGLFGLIGATYWKEGNSEEAIRHFRQAADALESSAADVKVEELLTSYLGSDRRWYFGLLVDMLVHEGQPMEAFAHAERARARAFLQLVGNHRLNAATSADPRLVAEAENVRAAIAEREQHAIAAKPEEMARIAADLARAREHYRALLIRMKTTNPEYEELTNVAPRKIETVREDLPPGTTLISYFVSARVVHAWVVDRDTAHYELLHLDAAALKPLLCWADDLGRTRSVELPDAPCNDNVATPADAYRALIAPLRKHIRHQKLVLVPHGVLHYIPFAALRDPETNRYLVQDYTLTYAPSASSLRFLQAKETPVEGGTLVLGDPVTPLAGLASLPGAKEEATFVARTLGTTPRLGADARETLLYGLNGKVDLVHLAAHALYDASNPLFSRIALATDEKNDGSLTVTEILSTIDLKGVNLVVLSACRSAMGQRSGGDEIVGLTRALLYAGTPGVISTLWNIDDTTATALMTRFYQRLGEGVTAAEALRDAQIAAIESKARSHPRQWSAFMLTGDPQGRWTADPAAENE